MSKASMYEEKTEALLQPVVEKLGLEIYDVEYVKEGSDWFLRAYIDKPGGVSIDDCVNVSRQFNEILDAEDYILDAYTFEVSSPGLGRALKKPKHFEKSLGEKVEVRTYRQMDGQKEFCGVLKSFDSNQVTISLEDESEMTFAKADIALVRLAFDF